MARELDQMFDLKIRKKGGIRLTQPATICRFREWRTTPEQSRLGAPIPGLYAVGSNGMGGIVIWGHELHIAWALTSGRIAGQNAALAPVRGPGLVQEARS